MLRVKVYYGETSGMHTACYCCPCGHTHCIPIIDTPEVPSGKVWSWNGNTENPTFKPSINTWMEDGKGNKTWVCHANVTDGVAAFCGDSTHALSGKSAPLREFKSVLED